MRKVKESFKVGTSKQEKDLKGKPFVKRERFSREGFSNFHFVQSGHLRVKLEVVTE